MSTEEKDKLTIFFEKLIAIAPWIFAGIILVGYGKFIKHLLEMAGVENNVWERATYIFSSIEAIVYTAVGFIFGKEVNKSRASTAEKNEQKQKQQKNELAIGLMNLQDPETPSSSKETSNRQEEISRLKHIAEVYLNN
ncbi:hypothetical protein [Pseudotenacibaculum haliotis]|uniref:Uncharacterized protein n=1 Tax=Pseudotenacibaculum haliotis TaxID=1862138 RepID=A0ABW5LWY5_9FLAO